MSPGWARHAFWRQSGAAASRPDSIRPRAQNGNDRAALFQCLRPAIGLGRPVRRGDSQMDLGHDQKLAGVYQRKR
ncbi:MAG TPA: hypothetical protein ACFYEF_03040 [Candidatus Wunengus sp. YC63]|uniref:hypothetical protein n=1 Tax=unclassified Candidatus Wunengus TaxID=3367695 RepID=UPI00402872B0